MMQLIVLEEAKQLDTADTILMALDCQSRSHSSDRRYGVKVIIIVFPIQG